MYHVIVRCLVIPIQSQLRALGGMDDLICGELYMYSYLLLTLHDAQAFTLIFSYVSYAEQKQRSDSESGSYHACSLSNMYNNGK